ncbi:MAG: glycosyltransferase family 2 protein [Phycisphaeraceae bacterium]|nr:glycosyltransferase family 2 protein [Phycisphaeraceae bacterium]MCB9847800.1 glycosyltransferase family 2 protein [Phycisphaeraceae bacterium]
MIATIARAPAPLVSVVVPTFRRPALLERALRSVKSQTFNGWELIVSDDDPGRDETARVVRRVFADDARVRLIGNVGEHGQAGNVNNGLLAARGQWIKPLFDDDALKPGALEAMLGAAALCPRAALVRCLTERVINGRSRGCERRGRRATVELIRQREAHLAMYLQDLDIGTPTAVLVNRRVIDSGVLFDAPEGISSSVDGWWFIRALRHGDLVLVNSPLVEMHQGGHGTVTSDTGDDERYAQFELLRKWLAPMIRPDNSPPPSVESAQAMIRLIRATRDAARGRPIVGLRRALAERDPVAWRLTLRWALRRAAPGRFEAVERIAVVETLDGQRIPAVNRLSPAGA